MGCVFSCNLENSGKEKTGQSGEEPAPLALHEDQLEQMKVKKMS